MPHSGSGKFTTKRSNKVSLLWNRTAALYYNTTKVECSQSRWKLRRNLVVNVLCLDINLSPDMCLFTSILLG